MDTEPLEHNDGFSDSLYENQVVIIPHDTEVLNDQDLVENSKDQQIDQLDNLVVPDSDDEALDTAMNKRSFRRRGCFSGRSIGALCKRHVQAKDLQLNDSSLFEAKDKNSVSSVACHIKCASDMKQMYGNDLMNQVKRKVSIVYTRKRKRVTCTFEDKSLRELMRSSIQGEEYAESQEAEDVSKALLFVDQYVSANAVHSSPVARVVKEKSPPALSAKGTKNLVRWVNIRSQTAETGMFEWDPCEEQTDSLVNKGQASLGGKDFSKTYVRKSPSSRDNISNILQKNTSDNSNKKKEELKGLTYSDTNLGNDFEDIVDFDQFNEKKALTKLGLGIVDQSEHVFDVGSDTQMAAEAMQELSFAAAAHCNADKAYSCSHTMLSESLSTLMRCPIQICFFPKKARSASRRKVNCPKGNWRISPLNGEDKISSGKCLGKGSLKNSGKVMFLKRSIVKRSRKVKTDDCKKNLYSLVSSDHDDLLLVNSPCQRKRKAFISDGGVDNMDEGLLNECIVREIVNKKVYSYDKGSMGANESNLDRLDQSQKCTEILHEKTSDDWNMREAEEDKKCRVLDDLKVNQLEIDIHDECKDGGLSATTSEVPFVNGTIRDRPCIRLSNVVNVISSHEDTSYANERPKNRYTKEYPRGKRTSRNMLRRFEKFVEMDGSHGTQNESSHRPSRSLFNSDSSFCLSYFGSNIKRKHRSSVYISPCWLSSLKNHDGSSLTKATTSMPLDKVVTAGSTSNEWGMSKADLRLMSDKSPVFHQTRRVGSPNSPLSNEMFLSDEIDGNCENGKKKATTSPLLRELVRLGFNESMPEFASKDSRRRKTMANIRVLFSQNLDKDTRKQQMKILRRFGIPMASSPADATHFVTKRFARTRNLLEFIAQGKPVVTHMWLESCEQAGSYIDEGNYILRDVKKELEIGFKLPVSLERAKNHPLLKGFSVAITPHTQPGSEMLSSLVKASHGQVIDLTTEATMKDKTVLESLLLLSCEEDRAYCAPFLQNGIAAYCPELLLNGIVTQKLELKRHQLFTDHV